MLLLHGGPGATDELYECFDAWFPGAGIEYYYYDQLGSFRSDQPDDPSLWDLARFVDEVEQVRQALRSGLRATSCCSGSRGAGSSRWSTPCTTRQHLKGLVISNMMASARLYNDVRHRRPDADDGPGRAGGDQALRGRGHAPTTRGTKRCSWSTTTCCTSAGIPLDEWPDPVSSGAGAHQPGDLRAHAGAERARPQRHSRGLGPDRATWRDIDVPTLVIGATHDTMDPAHMRWMSEQLPQGTLPALPRRQPLRAVRRPRALLPRSDRLPAVAVGRGPGCGPSQADLFTVTAPAG